MKLIVVSICKNEAATIKELIGRIPKKIKGIRLIEIVVVNDGSTDDTAKLAEEAGAIVDGDSRSKGLAIRFREATNIALKRGADVMVNIDGDLQFAPEDIPRFVAPIVADEADFVAADRFTDPKTGERKRPTNMSFVKYHGNQLGAWLVGKLSDDEFRDVTCGFRAYNQKALYALNTNSTHTYTQESFQVLAARKMRITPIPVEVRYFKERKSRVVTSVPKYIAVSIMNILRAFRDFAPLRFFIFAGMVPFVAGLGCLAFLLVHWISAGSLSPYKFVGFAGLYFISVGFMLWIVGLLADMNVRVLNNQEKIYEALRRHSYEQNEHKG